MKNYFNGDVVTLGISCNTN